jgi:hypothetical protein
MTPRPEPTPYLVLFSIHFNCELISRVFDILCGLCDAKHLFAGKGP